MNTHGMLYHIVMMFRLFFSVVFSLLLFNQKKVKYNVLKHTINTVQYIHINLTQKHFSNHSFLYLVCRKLLTLELEAVGIRLNKKIPNIYFKQKKGGGLSFNSTCTLTKISERLVQLILHEYSMNFHSSLIFLCVLLKVSICSIVKTFLQKYLMLKFCFAMITDLTNS